MCQGFRKVEHARWSFANGHFAKGGEEDLLKIRRRSVSKAKSRGGEQLQQELPGVGRSGGAGEVRAWHPQGTRVAPVVGLLNMNGEAHARVSLPRPGAAPYRAARLPPRSRKTNATLLWR